MNEALPPVIIPRRGGGAITMITPPKEQKSLLHVDQSFGSCSLLRGGRGEMSPLFIMNPRDPCNHPSLAQIVPEETRVEQTDAQSSSAYV